MRLGWRLPLRLYNAFDSSAFAIAEGRPLTRPELAVLLAWSKIVLFDDIVASGLPDDPWFEPVLKAYFPAPIDGFEKAMKGHRLRREITAFTGGTRAINMTRDIGIGAPQTYTGALKGDVGPFLRSVNGPYTEVNPDTGATETFVGDPNLNEAVTGSPFNTNFLRITGPAGTIQSNVFSLSGILMVLVLFILARVFRHGAAMREDLEGTV